MEEPSSMVKHTLHVQLLVKRCAAHICNAKFACVFKVKYTIDCISYDELKQVIRSVNTIVVGYLLTFSEILSVQNQYKFAMCRQKHIKIP